MYGASTLRGRAGIDNLHACSNSSVECRPNTDKNRGLKILYQNKGMCGFFTLIFLINSNLSLVLNVLFSPKFNLDKWSK